MKLFIRKTLYIFLLSMILSACDIDSLFDPDESPYYESETPYCEIINFEMEYFVYTKMKITIQNLGDGSTAYDVRCYIKLKDGNHIVDDASIYFGYLDYYESKTKEAVFIEVKSQSDYSYEEIKLGWQDTFGNYYESIY